CGGFRGASRMRGREGACPRSARVETRRPVRSSAHVLSSGDEEVCAHYQAYADHDVTHLAGIGFLWVVRGGPSPGERTHYHYCTLRPQNCASPDESEDRSRIDRRGQQGPNSAHGKDVAHT